MSIFPYVLLLCHLITIHCLNSRDLYYVYNAALVRALENGAIAKLEIKHSKTDVSDVISCYPNASHYTIIDEGSATGSLKEVLKTNTLLVGGLKFNTTDGDYISNPPVGFLPDFLRLIVEEMNYFYRRDRSDKIQIRYIYGNSVFDDIEGDRVYLSETYYYTTSSYKDQPTYRYFQLSCTSFAYQGKITIRKNTPAINSIYELIVYLKANPGIYKIGALSSGDFGGVVSVLPKSPTYQYVECLTYDEVISKLKTGDIFIGYTSGVPDIEVSDINIFNSGFVSPRASIFKRIDKP